jgi:hypothetical protein
MFAAEDMTIGTESRAAQARFVNLLHGNWLTEVSEAAYGGALTGLLRVGPGGPVATKLVRVSLVDPVYRDEVMTTGLRWDATGATGSLFPVLDANISICPADVGAAGGKESARLTLAGVYRPPLGRLGAGLDRAILHRVATATIRSLLRSVAEAITKPAPATAEWPSPSLRPGPETGII